MKILLTLFILLPTIASATHNIEFYDNDKPYYEFANFYVAPFEETGQGFQNDWKTSEHYFQGKKFNSNGTRHILDDVKKADTPRKAFDIAQRNAAHVRKNWHPTSGSDDRTCVKVNVMFDALNRKFEAHPTLKALLIATDGLNIYECSPIDPYWGTGTNNASGIGKNMLGKLLLELRDNYLGNTQTQSFKSYPISATPVDITNVTKNYLNQIGRWSYYEHLLNNPAQIISFDEFNRKSRSRSICYRFCSEGTDLPFPYPVSGFSGQELTHTWTDGPNATVRIPVKNNDNQQITRVTFKDTGGLVTAEHSQIISVFLGDQKVNDYIYDINKPLQTIEVSIPSGTMGDAVITFNIKNPLSPAELGINPDNRKLGILLRNIFVEY